MRSDTGTGQLGTLLPRIAGNLQFLSFELPTQIVLLTYLGMVLIGVLIGFFGSLIAMGRYLKV